MIEAVNPSRGIFSGTTLEKRGISFEAVKEPINLQYRTPYTDLLLDASIPDLDLSFDLSALYYLASRDFYSVTGFSLGETLKRDVSR